MKHDRRQMPREAVDLNNIDDDAQGTAPQEQNRFRIALDRTAAGVLLRWLTCLFLFCILCLALLFLPVAEGFVQLLQALAAFPAMLPLLRDAGLGDVYKRQVPGARQRQAEAQTCCPAGRKGCHSFRPEWSTGRPV